MSLSTKESRRLVGSASSLYERLTGSFRFRTDTSRDRRRVKRRIRNWKRSCAGGDEDKFRERLSWLDHTEESIRPLLGSATLEPGLDLPGWLGTLQLLLSTLEETDPGKVRSIEERFLDPEDPVPFEELLAFLVRGARGVLRSQVDTDRYRSLQNRAHAQLERNLLLFLSHRSSQTLLKTFANRNSRYDPDGSPSRSGYLSFVQHQLDGGFLEQLRTYPVLARNLGLGVRQWLRNTRMFLERLARDQDLLGETFGNGTAPGQVAEITTRISDRHNAGQTVYGVRFENGLQVAYKPRDLSAEKAVHDTLAELDRRGPPLRLTLPSILPRGDYGWTRWRAARPCDDSAGVSRYYHRAGGLLCLLTLLRVTDGNCENIVAHGDQPVIVDLETLLSSGPPHYAGGVAEARTRAIARFERTVMYPGLLPYWSEGMNNRCYDISGLGGHGGQKTGRPIRRWKDINTDRMRMNYRSTRTRSPENRPTLDGTPAEVGEYRQELLEGFTRYHRFTEQHGDVFRNPKGPLRSALPRTARYLHRFTWIYKTLRLRCDHPRYLRAGVDRSIEWDELARVMLRYPPDYPHRHPDLLESEHRQMDRMDIPSFRGSIDGTALYDGRPDEQETGEADRSGTLLEPRFFRDSGLAQMEAHLDRWGKEDRMAQTRLIRTSFRIRQSPVHANGNEDEPCSTPRRIPEEGGGDLPEEELEQEALQIGERLRSRAVQGSDDSVTWLAPYPNFALRCHEFKPLNETLAGGSGGISLFFAALSRVSDRSRWERLARDGLRSLQASDPSDGDDFVSVVGMGGMDGYPSMLYALAHVGHLLGDDKLLDRARKGARALSRESIQNEPFPGVLDGIAGALLVFLSLHRRTGDPSLMKRARWCGQELLKRGEERFERINRSDDGPGRRLGFAHGRTGVHYALTRLARMDEESTFADRAEPELEELESQIRSGRSDLRSKTGWCSGDAGLRPMDLIDQAGDPRPRILSDGVDHLCCGTLGRALLLNRTGRIHNRTGIVRGSRVLAGRVLEVGRTSGYRFYPGAHRGEDRVQPVGLLQGLAGIGLGWLLWRQKDGPVPNVLLLE